MNSSTPNQSARGSGHRRGRSSSRTPGRAVSNGHIARTDEDPELNAQDRDQFILSFNLNIASNSAPVLVSNDIRKLGDNCYSARLIREYFRNSNSHGYNIRIVQIWKVHNVRHYARFMQQNYDQVDNMLLWHGTSRRNLVSILQNNLQMPIVATNGHMFGPGVYFADRMSKSAGYTDQSGPEVFLLCQVALGKKWRVFKAESFQSPPQNFNSIKGVGKKVPDRAGEKMLGKYCSVPCGQTITHPDMSVQINSSLQHNEYIVFDQDRIRIKFIVHCERPGSTAQYTSPMNYVARPLATTRPLQTRAISSYAANRATIGTVGGLSTASSSSTLPSAALPRRPMSTMTSANTYGNSNNRSLGSMSSSMYSSYRPIVARSPINSASGQTKYSKLCSNCIIL